MLSYKLTPSLIIKLRNLNTHLAQRYVFVKNLSNDQRKAIHRYARISMIGASTRIENAQLTDSEIDWIDTILSQDGKTTAFDQHRDVIENKLSKDRERSLEEVAGCRSMLGLIYDNHQDMLPLTETIIRGLHYDLMRYYKGAGPNIGSYKIQPNSVVEINHMTGASRLVFQTADAGVITAAAMTDLIAWYNKALLYEPWSLAVACEFIFRFLAIHPFQDGNGRLGRGLFLLTLLQSREEIITYLVPYLAIDRHIESHKAEYYLTLNRCSEGKFSPDPQTYKIEYFLNFMIKIMEESLTDIDIYLRRYESVQNLSEASLKVLEAFKEHPELRLSTKILVKETQLPRRTINYGLLSLLEADLIQRYGQGAGVRYQLKF